MIVYSTIKFYVFLLTPYDTVSLTSTHSVHNAGGTMQGIVEAPTGLGAEPWLRLARSYPVHPVGGWGKWRIVSRWMIRYGGYGSGD